MRNIIITVSHCRILKNAQIWKMSFQFLLMMSYVFTMHIKETNKKFLELTEKKIFLSFLRKMLIFFLIWKETHGKLLPYIVQFNDLPKYISTYVTMPTYFLTILFYYVLFFSFEIHFSVGFYLIFLFFFWSN